MIAMSRLQSTGTHEAGHLSLSWWTICSSLTGSLNSGACRRRLLSVLLQQLPQVPHANPQTVAIAQRAAFEVALSRINSGEEIAEDAHLIGPSLCR